MKQFIALLRISFLMQFRGLFSKKRTKSQIATLIVSILIALLFASVLIVSFVFLGRAFEGTSLYIVFTLVVYIGTMFFSLFYGISSILTTLYFSRDNELVLSLPIKTPIVYCAKIVALWASQIVYSAMFLLPTLLSFGISMHLGALYFVAIPIAIIFLPLIQLSISSIIAIPVMYVVSFFKSRGTISSIIALVFFGLFFFFYLYGVQLVTLTNNGVPSNIEKVFTIAFYPIFSLVNFACGITTFSLNATLSSLANLAIFLGYVIVLALICFVLSMLFYRRGLRIRIDSSGDVKKSKNKNRGAVKSIMRREWLTLIRTPAFAFQCLAGIILCPIIVVFTSITMPETQIIASIGTLDLLNSAEHLAFSSLAIILFISNVASPACTSITRDGSNYYYMKIIPVSYKKQFMAKMCLYTITSSIASLVSVIIAVIFNFSIVNVILMPIFVLIFNAGFNAFALLRDLKNPNLTWITPKEAVKSIKATFVPLLICIGFGAICIYLHVLLIKLGEILSVALSWVVLFVLAITFAVVSNVMLFTKCEKYANKL